MHCSTTTKNRKTYITERLLPTHDFPQLSPSCTRTSPDNQTFRHSDNQKTPNIQSLRFPPHQDQHGSTSPPSPPTNPSPRPQLPNHCRNCLSPPRTNTSHAPVSAYEETYLQIRLHHSDSTWVDAARGIQNLRAGFNSDEGYEAAYRWYEDTSQHLDVRLYPESEMIVEAIEQMQRLYSEVRIVTLAEGHTSDVPLRGHGPNNSNRVEEVKAFLEHLPKVPEDELPDNEECVLCKEPFGTKVDGERGKESEHPVKLPCGHIFGSSCIAIWLEKEGKTTCPYCRHQLFGTSSDFEDLPLRLATLPFVFPNDIVYMPPNDAT